MMREMRSYWDTVASGAENYESKRFEEDLLENATKNWLAEYANKKAQYLLLNLIERAIKFNETMKILDVGCGPGKWSIMFAKKHVSVTGIDLSARMVKLAKKKANLNNLKNIKFYRMNVAELHFPEDTFDLVNCVTVIQHIFDDQKWKNGIHEMVRVTKSNGYIVICEMAPLLAPVKYTRHLCIRTMKQYVSEFTKAGAILLYWRVTDLSYPITAWNLRKFSSSFKEEEVYYYKANKDNIVPKFLSFLSKILATLAEPIDYNLAKTPLGILSPIKVMLFRKDKRKP